jgi:hypothetical protein
MNNNDVTPTTTLRTAGGLVVLGIFAGNQSMRLEEDVPEKPEDW